MNQGEKNGKQTKELLLKGGKGRKEEQMIKENGLKPRGWGGIIRKLKLTEKEKREVKL